jgi:predicted nucleic acid-binding Zn ribbon protein
MSDCRFGVAGSEATSRLLSEGKGFVNVEFRGQDEDAGFCEDLAQRQRRTRGPQRMAEALSRLMTRSGYAQQQLSDDWQRLWSEVAGENLAQHCRVGRLRAGVLQIMVRNSSVLQELSFRKRDLLNAIAAKARKADIRDLRFRIGEID